MTNEQAIMFLFAIAICGWLYHYFTSRMLGAMEKRITKLEERLDSGIESAVQTLERMAIRLDEMHDNENWDA